MELEKGAVSRHLKLCSGAAAARDIAAGKIKAFHILVEGRHLPEYWLHLSVPAPGQNCRCLTGSCGAPGLNAAGI